MLISFYYKNSLFFNLLQSITLINQTKLLEKQMISDTGIWGIVLGRIFVDVL